MKKAKGLEQTKDLAIDGCYGPATKEAFVRWQRRCGFSGSDADGIPGETSLQRLGLRER